ncbi:hypothetical protein [Streptomyces sp. NPDC057910]|uniref:hypothetical protein n=1 Tax=Streptomyces sp. NPDC057910 TaxID=3346278 RepID=UPI0036F01869
MTSTEPQTSIPTDHPIARRITDVLEPKNWLLVITLVVGWHADRLAGIAWGLIAGVFSAVLPILWIKWGEKRGHWGDRHIRRRQDRLIVIPGIMVSVLAGIALMVVFDAPREVLALILAMMASLIVFMAVTAVWKISFHTAVPAGAVAVAALIYGPWALTVCALIVVIGWSRVVLKDHTLAQVLAGAAAGGSIAACVFTLMR